MKMTNAEAKVAGFRKSAVVFRTHGNRPDLRFLSHSAETPGVYIWRIGDEVVYVGKAGFGIVSRMKQHKNGWLSNVQRRRSILSLLGADGEIRVDFRESSTQEVTIPGIALAKSKKFSIFSLEEEALIDHFSPVLNSAGIKKVITVKGLERRLVDLGDDEQFQRLQVFLEGLSTTKKKALGCFLKSMGGLGGQAWANSRAKFVRRYAGRQVNHIVIGSGMANDQRWIARIPMWEDGSLEIFIPRSITRQDAKGELDEFRLADAKLDRFNANPKNYVDRSALYARALKK